MLKDRPILRQALIAALTIAAALLGYRVVEGAEREPFQQMPLQVQAPPKPAACVTYTTGRSLCSATCIDTHNGRSLLLSCHHCFSGQRGLPVNVLLSDGRTRLRGVTVLAESSRDMALLIAEGTIPPADVDGALPPVGAVVEHWGHCSGYTRGQVTRFPGWSNPLPKELLRSTCNSCPGDSGCGVFRNGKLVAVNWGIWLRTQEAAHTPVAFAGELVQQVPGVRKIFPRIADKFGVPPGDGPVAPPIVLPPESPIPPVAPPIYVPPQYPPKIYTPPPRRCRIFPRLFPRLRGCR